MASVQTLDEGARRRLAGWAAGCAERVLPLFEARSSDPRPRDGITRARAFARGELDAASQIRRRFEAGRGAGSVVDPAAVAAARAAGQASGVAHMGAHALGAAAYAAKAAGLAGADAEQDRLAEIDWQLDHLTDELRAALAGLPLLGQDRSGPLGTGLLTTGVLGDTIRRIQTALHGER